MAKPKVPKNGDSEPEGPAAIERAIQRAVDALDLLRILMREAGMTACADALDDAFAKCVKEYIERKDDGTVGHRPRRRRSGKKLN
ncbi:hypothetical protein [Asticcacaulis sp.]|uniref:hypothetical protein n=1 Tax=Asticcacaulis sp. TaxID=1872648 RepID=UPI002BB9EA76|nr:hypothetical protein [Asticcacaulis sp.]HTM81555.1 hypothetical protein [Asticcacaulis sp.]